mmetsp:Transcript_24441/g.50816  ORF Transcript_24441/g.50816 Transcript_24441/m.50816 type:complete len:233 (+) Transcript_24441:316-1014(+)
MMGLEHGLSKRTVEHCTSAVQCSAAGFHARLPGSSREASSGFGRGQTRSSCRTPSGQSSSSPTRSPGSCFACACARLLKRRTTMQQRGSKRHGKAAGALLRAPRLSSRCASRWVGSLCRGCASGTAGSGTGPWSWAASLGHKAPWRASWPRDLMKELLAPSNRSITACSTSAMCPKEGPPSCLSATSSRAMTPSQSRAGLRSTSSRSVRRSEATCRARCSSRRSGDSAVACL